LLELIEAARALSAEVAAQAAGEMIESALRNEREQRRGDFDRLHREVSERGPALREALLARRVQRSIRRRARLKLTVLEHLSVPAWRMASRFGFSRFAGLRIHRLVRLLLLSGVG
jgi:hypothetical protein